jgi:hypothetical protein
MKVVLISLSILLIIAFLGLPLVDSKDYLRGAITIDKINSQSEIEAITFHFRDFPYDISSNCHFPCKGLGDFLSSPKRTVTQYNDSNSEIIVAHGGDSPFAGIIQEYHPIERRDYINKLVEFCSHQNIFYYYSSSLNERSSLNQLARDNTTTAITFYPKIIDGKTCTVLEYTGLMNFPWLNNYEDKPTNVVGLFVPLNETKDGCDRYLMLCSGNQTAAWLDSVKVAFLSGSLGESKGYLKGTMTVDKSNSIGEIEAITFHFRDFYYDISSDCRLSNRSINDYSSGPERTVYQNDNSHWEEEMKLGERHSPFAVLIRDWMRCSINRSDYINELTEFCSGHSYIPGITGSINQLARENTTIGLIFNPKIIDNKTCTVLEYIGPMNPDLVRKDYELKPTNVVGLFMPLNETKEGCDRYLMLCGGNQTADWLDSVKVSKHLKGAV